MPGTQDCNTTKCQRDTYVDIYSKAHAKATPLAPCVVDFPVELDVHAKPRCTIRDGHIKKNKHGCATGCSFDVRVEFDFDTKIHCPVKHTRCPVRLDIETNHVTKCHDEEKPCKPCSEPKPCCNPAPPQPRCRRQIGRR